MENSLGLVSKGFSCMSEMKDQTNLAVICILESFLMEFFNFVDIILRKCFLRFADCVHSANHQPPGTRAAAGESNSKTAKLKLLKRLELQKTV